MYVTTPSEKWIVKPCGFTNTAAATGATATTAVKYDSRERGLECFGTTEV